VYFSLPVFTAFVAVCLLKANYGHKYVLFVMLTTDVIASGIANGGREEKMFGC
jgi:hypothetical protein